MIWPRWAESLPRVPLYPSSDREDLAEFHMARLWSSQVDLDLAAFRTMLHYALLTGLSWNEHLCTLYFSSSFACGYHFIFWHSFPLFFHSLAFQFCHALQMDSSMLEFKVKHICMFFIMYLSLIKLWPSKKNV